MAANVARLFVETPLRQGSELDCPAEHTHYLTNVLRLKAGGPVLLFNGRDGEWRAEIVAAGKRSCRLRATSLVRPQTDGPDIDYLFAPLKRERLDYMVQKATELGVARLRPVLTERTIAERVNLHRMRANTIVAAEQCGVLRVPRVLEPQALTAALATLDSNRTLIHCDEQAPVASPLDALAGLNRGPLAVLIGPEGGFSEKERAMLAARPRTVSISLGPRIMRADTAAVAALSLVNAALGDWR